MTADTAQRGVSSTEGAPSLCSRGDGRVVHAQGLCQACYRRQRRNGQVEPLTSEQRRKPGPAPDPSRPRSRYREPVVRVPKPPVEKCPQGHRYTVKNTYVTPDGYKQCRICQRKRMQERRPAGPGAGAFNKAKTHCPHGHPYDESNTVTYGKRRVCRTCARANSTIQIIKKYGITLERYEEMMKVQEGRCAICHERLDAKPDIDHDHKCCPGTKACGKCVRGLLCRDCNIGISRFDDDPLLLRAAAEYLGHVIGAVA